MLLAPLAGILFLAVIPATQARWVALVISLVSFVVSLGLLNGFAGEAALNPLDPAGYLWYEALPWIDLPGWKSQFALGLDGISLYLVLLTTLLFPLMVLFAWDRVEKQPKLFFLMLLLMESAILGFFLSLDMLLFYVCFELVLIPAIFFIGIWGSENRQKAAIKFFVYTLAGSLIMLVAIIYMGLNAGTGVFTTDYFDLVRAGFSPREQYLLFLAFALSFGIKAPIFPLHTWQADAYSESSTTGTVIMAAILSKMGVYGLLRFCVGLFPEGVARYAPLMATLAVIGILYGAMAAFAQKDMKRLLAFSSLSHLGFIVLGIFALQREALNGAVLQMFAHGIATAGLFFLVGMIETRTGSRQIGDYRGLAKQLPIFAFLFVLSVMASVGLPGLSGFVGEFMILLGAFSSSTIGGVFAVLAALGVIAAAVYLLNMTRQVLFGKAENATVSTTQDLSRREWGLLLPLAILMVVIGLYATPFLKQIDRSTAALVETTEEVEAPAETPEDVSFRP